MKQTTKKLLLWLYQTDISLTRSVSVQELRLILPELKKSGYRSLLNLLKSQQYLSFDQESQLVTLTSHGRNALEAQFPVLETKTETWKGEWQLITFIEAPSSDKQFRYLRQYLLANRCGQLTRGSYLFPGQLPAEVMTTLQRLYVGKVLVTGLASWIFGDELLVIGTAFGLNDLKSGYSGISKEIHLLLKQRNQQKSIEDKDKMMIAMVFNRLIEFLATDLGLLQYYYPGYKSGPELLAQLQDLFKA